VLLALLGELKLEKPPPVEPGLIYGRHVCGEGQGLQSRVCCKYNAERDFGLQLKILSKSADLEVHSYIYLFICIIINSAVITLRHTSS